jgi:hypothetical protein
MKELAVIHAPTRLELLAEEGFKNPQKFDKQ